MFDLNQTLFTEIAPEIVHEEFSSHIPSATLRKRRSGLENRFLCQYQDSYSFSTEIFRNKQKQPHSSIKKLFLKFSFTGKHLC